MSSDDPGFQLDGNEPLPTGFRRFQWLVLTATASLVLLATTNMVCQDIAVVPFLWIVPLSLYLLSFIICFGRVQWVHRSVWSLLTPLVLCLLASREVLEGYGYAMGLAGETALTFAALFCVCMLCHGETVRLRPAPRHLTEFYLWIGIGGALGGFFAGLVAPWVFVGYTEWCVGVALGWAIALVVLIQDLSLRYSALKLACFIFAALATLSQMITLVSSDAESVKVIAQSRSFYGVVAVCEQNAEDAATHALLMRHGSTHHGGQFADAAKSGWPTTYYGEESGVGRVLSAHRQGSPIRVGAIGLGVGTIATYARPGDEYRFYEINSEVLRLAWQYFTYLTDCKGNWDVVLGDGRISLEREDPQNFNILVLDAFSSDAIPVHLLTREAFALYRQHLMPGGVIAVHITNRHLALEPVIRGIARHFGWRILMISTREDEERLIFDADWVLLTEDDRFREPVPSSETADQPPVVMWTDHYSSLFPVLKTVFRGIQ